MPAVANHEACFGDACERRQECLRRAVLSGNVPCFPVMNRLCSAPDYKAFVQWDGKRPVAAGPSLFQ